MKRNTSSIQSQGEPKVVGCGPCGTADGEAGPHGPAATLEPEDNTVSWIGVEVAHKRCRRRLCPICASRLGWLARKRLLLKAESFHMPRLLTLTVDGLGTVTKRGFESAEVAYEYVRRGRFVARLMDRLGIHRWFAVLEFQQNGFPHWHVLVDIAGLPGCRYEYGTAWHYWRDVWKIGSWKDSGVSFESPVHAVMYVTKYLTKTPEHGFPSWLWQRRVAGHRGAVRFLAASRSIGPIFGAADDAESVDPADESDWHEGDEDEAAPDGSKRYADLVARCGAASRLFAVGVDREGVEHRRFIAELPVSPGHLAGDGEVARVVRVILGLEVEDESQDANVDVRVECGPGWERKQRRVLAPLSWWTYGESLKRGLTERFGDGFGYELPLWFVGPERESDVFCVPRADGIIAEAMATEAAYLASRRGAA